MKTSSVNLDNNGITGVGLKNTLLILSCYPYIFAVITLLGGVLGSDNLGYLGMVTMVIYILFGTMAWITILSCLVVKRKITFKLVTWNLLILITGYMIAFYVVEYDVFSSGVKYMD